MSDSVYAQDGVPIDAEEVWSKRAHALCRDTFSASPYVQIAATSGAHFRLGGGYRFVLPEPDMTLDAAADGVGTKGVLAALTDRYEAAAHDLVAMIAHDLAREGGTLALLTTILTVDRVEAEGMPGFAALERMLTELARIAREHHFALYKGETAQVGSLLSNVTYGVAPVRFMWEGVGHGVFHPSRRILREELQAGQLVIALRERGFRCNGISSVRKALELRFGPAWHASEEARPHVHAAAEPSALYLGLTDAVLGWQGQRMPLLPLYALAHITGGGIPGKFGEDILFRAGLSASLTDLWEPPEIMRHAAEWRGVSPLERYRVWNGGQGMLAVVDPTHADEFVSLAHTHDVEAKVCGELYRSTHPELLIRSQYGDAETLRYTPRT